MKIALAGPILTAQLGEATGLDPRGLPEGQAATPLAPLAAGLLAEGHEVHIVTLDTWVDAPVTARRGALTVTWAPMRGPPRYRARIRSRDLFAREIAHLRAVLAEAGPDIVHAHWTYEYAEAAIRSRLPALVTMHDLGWHYLLLFRDPYRAMRLLMKYRAMPRVRHLSVVAPFMAGHARRYGYFGAVDVVPNGVAIPARDRTADRAAGLATPVLVSIGNAGRIKNIAASLAAFRLIRAAIPAAELHLFGPGLDADFAAGAAGVVAHGHVAHPRLMAFLEERATLLVHPSRLECCPAIVIEAKARGIPAIGGMQAGGVGYAIGEDRGGLTVDIADPSAIAAAAIALLGDAGRYRAMARAARDDAADRFDCGHVARQYAAIYARILGTA